MAWTTPRLWSDGEIVTAAIMNTHVRDNLTDLDSRVSNAGLRQFAIDKSSVEESSSSATFTDTNLSISFTPESSTSTIVVLAAICGLSQSSASATIGLRLVRDGSVLDTFVDGGELQLVPASTGVSLFAEASPGTSAVTYKIQHRRTSGTTNALFNTGGDWQSTLLVMEFNV